MFLLLLHINLVSVTADNIQEVDKEAVLMYGGAVEAVERVLAGIQVRFGASSSWLLAQVVEDIIKEFEVLSS